MAATTSTARDSLRAAIFSSENAKPKTKVIKFFGQEIELRQPPVGTILDVRNQEEKERKEIMIDMIIQYAYVPNTDERLFESGDRESLLRMPYGEDFNRLSIAIAELSDVNIGSEEARKN